MVNDNVQYHGEEIPVDLILSDFAEQSGFLPESGSCPAARATPASRWAVSGGVNCGNASNSGCAMNNRLDDARRRPVIQNESGSEPIWNYGE